MVQVVLTEQAILNAEYVEYMQTQSKGYAGTRMQVQIIVLPVKSISF